MSAARLIVSRVLRAAILPRARVTVTPRVVATQNTVALWRRYSTQKAEQSDEQFDAQWEAYFNREDIDAWELRNGVNDLYGHDLVPEPKIVIAMLKAARRLDDVAMAIRILESVKQKAGGNAEVYSYVIDEIRPTLKELGIATPEELNLA